ncbi:MAG: PQQ-dependent sugar dehydrogenase [Spirochaetales bacterium]|nr:PQQ-dependent sugar dehydrogenase [Spirochaetales bacterium]
MKSRLFIIIALSIISVYSLNALSDRDSQLIRGNGGTLINAEDFGVFYEPWAMTFLPDGELLITEKPGNLYKYNIETRNRIKVSGVPAVAYGGQGGLGDIILHPDYRNNHIVYLSYAEAGSAGRRGAAVAMAELGINDMGAELKNLKVIWRQDPKATGSGHYSHRLAFDSSGYLYITSGERQQQTPAQDWTVNLGKIIRLHDDGTVPADNPFQDRGELAKTFWTLGHRNMLGIALDRRGRLWVHEMGPRHGDELNLIVKGENYGWPLVSWGNQYSGADIPDHDTRPEFQQPEAYWVPSIAPSGLVIYSGDLFNSWQDNAIMGGLVSQSLIRVETAGPETSEIERFPMGSRIREVEQGPEGALWVLEDGKNARLRKLTPLSAD